MTPPRAWVWSLETQGIKLGLDAMRALLDALGHPEQAFRSMIVAGTNGKGSVTAMIERGLREAGCRSGRYTSPHLTAIEERIAVDGTPITPAEFDAAAARVQRATATWNAPPSFFEATTAMAFDAFRARQIDIAVVEVGLGGRLDATNVLAAPLAVITRIGLDHQAYLGETISAIAGEKAGVIAPGARVVVAPNPPDALSVIQSTAARQGATVWPADRIRVERCRPDARGTTMDMATPRGTYSDVRVGLPGAHQIDNARTALRALEVAADLDWVPWSESILRAGLGDVVWPARLEWRRYRHHDVLVDGAHNIDGAEALRAFLVEHLPSPVTMVIGVMRDKDVDAMLQPLLAQAGRVITTAVPGSRALEPHLLAERCRRIRPDLPIESAETPESALDLAVASPTAIVIAGSLYLAGHVRGSLA